MQSCDKKNSLINLSCWKNSRASKSVCLFHKQRALPLKKKSCACSLTSVCILIAERGSDSELKEITFRNNSTRGFRAQRRTKNLRANNQTTSMQNVHTLLIT